MARDLNFVASLRHANGLDMVRNMPPRDLERVLHALRADLARNGKQCRQAAVWSLLDYVETRLQFAAPRSGHPNLWPAMNGRRRA